MFCENCGNQMADDSKFCMFCGVKVEEKDTVQEAAASAESTAALDSATTLDSAAALDSNLTTCSEISPVFEPAAASAQSVDQTQSQPAQSQFVQQKPVQSNPVQSSQTPPMQPQTVQTQTVQPQTAKPQQSIVSESVNIEKPAKTTPLPVWKYIGIFLLMCIPVLGLVMLFVWSFGSSFNRNTKNFAIATLIFALLIIILTIAGYFTIWTSLSDIIADFNLPFLQ